MNEIHVLQRADGIGDVATKQERHLRSETARDLGAKGIRDTGDEDAARPDPSHGRRISG
jgi:hypothetical protein